MPDDSVTVVCSCGSKLFWESTRCNGWWKALVDANGNIEDTNLDEVRYGTRPATVVCVQCGKRNPNPCAWKEVNTK